MAYLSSNKFLMYPSSTRSDAYDRNARLNVAANIVGVSNRFNKNFVVEGLTTDPSASGSGTLLPGKCVINGYQFTLKDSFAININGSETNNRLAFRMKTKLINGFEEVIAFDSPDDVSIDLDHENLFRGISIEAIPANTDEIIIENGITTHTLFIAEWATLESKWLTIYSLDGSENEISNHRPNTFKMWAEHIGIKGHESENEFNSNAQDLFTFLTENLTIDDGRVN